VSTQKKIARRQTRRAFRVRNKLDKINRTQRIRVAVYRSNKAISAQIINDETHTTLVSLGSQHLKDAKGDKSAVAKLVGIELGKRAREMDIECVMFDRGSYLYHGRVKALADGLREGGLQF
jgi:large subunit ribosomal protein L18